MYKERRVTLIMLFIFQLLCALPSAIMSASVALQSVLTSASVALQSRNILTAYLLRRSPIRPFVLQVFLKKNGADKWSGIQTTYDPIHNHSLLTMLAYLDNNNIKDIKGGMVTHTGRHCLIQLTNGAEYPQISDSEWFNIDKVSHQDQEANSPIPGKETLCRTTQALITWRESCLRSSRNDPLRLFEQ